MIRAGNRIMTTLHLYVIILLIDVNVLHFGAASSGFLTSTLFTFQDTACDGEQLRLRCPSGTIITIQSAEYGRRVPSYQVCPADNKGENSRDKGPSYSVYGSAYGGDYFQEDTNCLATTSFRVLLDRCQNRQHCHVVASTNTFRQDPCPRTSKYLKVAYKCNPNNFTTETVCEGGDVTLSCQKSTRIAIYSALFGRASTDTETCSSDSSYADCRSSTAIEEVMTRCHGRKHCNVEAKEYVFGNPCPFGIPKYLRIVYTCVPRKILKQLGRHKHKKKKKKKKHKQTTDRGSSVGSIRNIPSTTMTVVNKVLNTITQAPPDIYPADDAKQRNDKVRTGNLEEDPNKDKKGSTEVDVLAATPVLCVNYSTVRPPGGQAPKNSRYDNAASGMVVDWFKSFYFLSENKEKAFLYMTLGACFGIITLLIIIVIKLIIQTKRKTKAKLDVTDPAAACMLPPSNHADVPTLSRTESIDRIEVVRFEPRSTLRRHHGDYDNTVPLRTDFEPSSTLRSDQGDRSLSNYYG